MPFKKGKPKTGGIQVGQKQNKTLAWEEFGQQVLEAGMPRMLELIKTGDDRQMMETMNMLIEYFKPKLSRSEVTATNTTIIHLDNLPKEDLKTLSKGLTPGE